MDTGGRTMKQYFIQYKNDGVFYQERPTTKQHAICQYLVILSVGAFTISELAIKKTIQKRKNN